MAIPEHEPEPIPISASFPGLEGRCALVTGASRGVGVGIARFLGRQAMRLVLTARSEERGLAVTDELRQRGVDCHWVTADAATKEGADRVLQEALEQYGGVDLLVNNAACLRSTDFLNLDEENYRVSFELNVRIVYELSLRVARLMAGSAEGGSIINISSVGGLRSHRASSGYDASKGAIDALTRSMSLDLAPHGIRVNAVAPCGPVLRPAMRSAPSVGAGDAREYP